LGALAEEAALLLVSAARSVLQGKAGDDGQ